MQTILFMLFNMITFLPLVIIMAILHFILLWCSKVVKAKTIERHTWISLVSLDRLANTMLCGKHTETISSRVGKRHINGCLFCGVICRFLDLFEKDHCVKSIERERDDSTGDC